MAPAARMRRRCVSASSRLSTFAAYEPFAPYRIVPVEKIRGPTTSPAFRISAWVKIVPVSFDGSWIVVTPRARDAKSTQLCCGTIPSSPIPPCQCASTRPGMTVFPVASTTVAPGGTGVDARGPTAAMRFSRTTTTPSGITSSPLIVTTRAPTIARVADGLSAAWLKPIFTPLAGGFGSSDGAPGTNANVSSSRRVKSSSPRE